MIQEGNMGEWKTVYEDEVEEHWVTVKVYESEDDKDEDGSSIGARAHDAPGALPHRQGLGLPLGAFAVSSAKFR
jgi:hypothetical protein